jgi:hypothetical protein
MCIYFFIILLPYLQEGEKDDFRRALIVGMLLMQNSVIQDARASADSPLGSMVRGSCGVHGL